MALRPQHPRAQASAVYGRSLNSANTRYLLGRDLPEIPDELIDHADPYLLTIISAALLDGNERRDDVGPV